jgi:hypothetical protein
MSSVVRAPQQRISKAFVCFTDNLGSGGGGPVHRLANFSEQLAEYATAVSATLYTVANESALESLLNALGGGPSNNFKVPAGNAVTDMGKTVTVQVASDPSVSAEFQLVAIDAAECEDATTTVINGIGYINTKITRGASMSQSVGYTYFARI